MTPSHSGWQDKEPACTLSLSLFTANVVERAPGLGALRQSPGYATKHPLVPVPVPSTPVSGPRVFGWEVEETKNREREQKGERGNERKWLSKRWNEKEVPRRHITCSIFFPPALAPWESYVSVENGPVYQGLMIFILFCQLEIRGLGSTEFVQRNRLRFNFADFRHERITHKRIHSMGTYVLYIFLFVSFMTFQRSFICKTLQIMCLFPPRDYLVTFQ